MLIILAEQPCAMGGQTFVTVRTAMYVLSLALTSISTLRSILTGDFCRGYGINSTSLYIPIVPLRDRPILQRTTRTRSQLIHSQVRTNNSLVLMYNFVELFNPSGPEPGDRHSVPACNGSAPLASSIAHVSLVFPPSLALSDWGCLFRWEGKIHFCHTSMLLILSCRYYSHAEAAS